MLSVRSPRLVLICGEMADNVGKRGEDCEEV